MYPNLPGPASALTIATVIRGHDLTDAATRSAVARERQQARRRARRAAAAAPARETHELHRWLLGHAAFRLHKRPPVTS